MAFRINYVKYENDRYPLHMHDDYEIIAYTQGAGYFQSESAEFPVERGSIVIIPPGVVHGTKQEGELQSIYVGGEFAQMFHFSAPVLLHDNGEQEGLALVDMIYRNRYENSDYLHALCHAFAHFILQNLKMEDGISLAVKEIVRSITERFHNPDIDVRALLCQSGYAEDYIRAQFKKITGKCRVFLRTLSRNTGIAR